MKNWDVSVLPAVRVSDRVTPEVRACMSRGGLLRISARCGERTLQLGQWELKAGIVASVCPALDGIDGVFEFRFDFLDADGVSIGHRNWLYEKVPTNTVSTALLDGCWIDLYHWSQDEGKWFNKALGELTEEDWKEQIRSMARIGIRGVVIQELFYIHEYVGTNSLTLENYYGQAFYPSDLYPGRFGIRAKDVLNAVLQAADECGMHVLAGIGLFAWFDFSPVSLEWHKRVAAEVFEKYGHYDSFYGFYVSEEIPGCLYEEHLDVDIRRWREVVEFFREFKAFVNRLSPTKPVALAPSNYRFQDFEREWSEILKNVDILLPFGFARDLESLNIREIADICKKSCTHFWVDMEIFRNPFDNGLIPKHIDELTREIHLYDDIEQIYGYEYTGHLNAPESPHDLGGESAKQLYRDYRSYYHNRGGSTLGRETVIQ